MKSIGIIAEYNPFHNGHYYHLNIAKNMSDADVPVICVMSGDYVQRGEPALFSKFVRAEMACTSGCNLVVELPMPWCSSTAELFAFGAVFILDALGVSDLFFGAENDIKSLIAVSDFFNDSVFIDALKKIYAGDRSLTYPRAIAAAVKELDSENLYTVLNGPNNTLGVEYIRAIRKLNSSIIPHSIERVGNGHDKFGDGNIKSASELRYMIKNNIDICSYVPANVYEIVCRESKLGHGPVFPENLEMAIMSRLKQKQRSDFILADFAPNGLEDRLFRAVEKSGSLKQIFEYAKSKNYTESCIRQQTILSATGLTSFNIPDKPAYVRILAADKTGLNYLKNIKGKNLIPIISKPADVRRLDDNAVSLFEYGSKAHDMFVLGYDDISSKISHQDFTTSPILFH